MVTVEQINEQNRAFWARQRDLMDTRMANEAVLGSALNKIKSELVRRVSACSQMSFELALEEAADDANRFSTQFAKKGGKAKKQDALQKMIVEAVQRRPTMSEQELRDYLSSSAGNSAIDDITERAIAFHNDDGRIRDAPLSGLKDRLSRAKKEIRSR